MNVRVIGVPTGLACRFQVVDSAGRISPAGGWRSGSWAWYPASSAVVTGHLRAFEVIVGGRVLARADMPRSARQAAGHI